MSLEEGGALSHENVLDQMRLVIIDTTVVTVFRSLLLLSINQEYQERVVDELRTIFETVDCDVTPKHLAGMKYTERVIKETMRLIPPVPYIARETTADIEFPNGTVPTGSIIGVSLIQIDFYPKTSKKPAQEIAL